jgi:hypothetical protein
VAADRFEHVIGHAHLGELRDDRVTQIVEPQAVRPAPSRSARQAVSHFNIGFVGS